MTSIREAYRPYTDKYGLIHDWPVATERLSGNCLLRTAQYAAILSLRGELTEESKDQFWFALGKCEKEPGLFVRHPDAFTTDQQQQDDLTGVVLLSALCGFEYTQRLRDYLHEHPYRFGFKSYYATEPQYMQTKNVRAWMGRYPALFAQISHALGETPNPILRTVWSGAVATTGKFGPGPMEDGGQDSFFLSLNLVLTPGSYSPLEEWAKRRFHARVREVWGLQGMRACAYRYFENKSHPHITYLPDATESARGRAG